MHLQLNLSNQLIKQWKPTMSDNPPETHPLLRWRIDKIKLDRTTANYICVNEESLFSFLLPRLPGKTDIQIQQLFIDRLLVILDVHSFPVAALALFDNLPVLYGKSNNPKLTGTITSMRHSYECQYFMETPLFEAEDRVNRTPFQGPNYRFPLTEFLKLRTLFDDPDGDMIQFQMPKELVYTARSFFSYTEPPALYCFEDAPDAHGNFTGQLSLHDLIQFSEWIMDILDQDSGKAESLLPVLEFIRDAREKTT